MNQHESEEGFTVLRALRDAYRERDASRFADVLSEDFILWHNFDCIEMGRNDAVTSAIQMFEAFSELAIEVKRQIWTRGPLIQEHLVSGTLKSGVRVGPIPSCIIVSLRGELITRIDEYMDPSPLLAAMKEQVL